MALAPDRAKSRHTEESCSDGWSHRKQDQCIALHETQNGSSGASVTWCFQTRSAAVQTAVGRDGYRLPTVPLPFMQSPYNRCTGVRGDQRLGSTYVYRLSGSGTVVVANVSAGRKDNQTLSVTSILPLGRTIWLPNGRLVGCSLAAAIPRGWSPSHTQLCQTTILTLRLQDLDDLSSWAGYRLSFTGFPQLPPRS